MHLLQFGPFILGMENDPLVFIGHIMLFFGVVGMLGLANSLSNEYIKNKEEEELEKKESDFHWCAHCIRTHCVCPPNSEDNPRDVRKNPKSSDAFFT